MVAELKPEAGSPWVLGYEYEELFSILMFWRKGNGGENIFCGSGYRGKSESSFSLM
jgi:hypothetical protein